MSRINENFQGIESHALEDIIREALKANGLKYEYPPGRFSNQEGRIPFFMDPNIGLSPKHSMALSASKDLSNMSLLETIQPQGSPQRYINQFNQTKTIDLITQGQQNSLTHNTDLNEVLSILNQQDQQKMSPKFEQKIFYRQSLMEPESQLLNPNTSLYDEEEKEQFIYNPQKQVDSSLSSIQQLDSILGKQYQGMDEENVPNETILFESQRDLEDTLVIISPLKYQRNIVQKIKEQWHVQNSDDLNFGSIVFLDTGAGKTYIAIMMIKDIFGEKEEIKMLNESQMKLKRDLRKDSVTHFKQKKVVFLVPTNNLVDQQGNVIDQFTERIVGKFHGGQKYKKFYKEHETWHTEFQNNDVFIFNGKKFYDLLLHGYLNIDQIDLLIFDECHHTDQDHLYNLVMKDFYYHKYDPKITKRPRILGLTASPIKSKIDNSSFSMKSEIQDMLQNLCNNLYSQFIPISEQDLLEIKKDIQVQIISYEEQLQENICIVKSIEKDLIEKLLEFVPLPKCYKVEDTSYLKGNQVMNFVQSCIFEEFVMEQDQQILQFLDGRKKLIELDSNFAKTNIDLAQFQDTEQRHLVLLCIIILKNINNLLIELGMAGVMAFLQNLRDDFVDKGSRFKKFKERLLEIIESFIHKHSFQQKSTMNSQKVQKLIEILRNQRSNPDQQLGKKTIIFVKDRTVAYYLRSILKFEFGNYSQNQSSQNHSSFLDSFSDRSRESQAYSKNPLYTIGIAMGQKGRSLLSKAYKSTNTGGFDIERDITYLSQAFGSSVQMSNAELMKNLSDFKSGKVNILIATNVVEEGLDVSTCNQVICLNELFTVKAFIQMKGRARQQNSKFIFICSREQEQSVMNDYDTFKNVIENMQQIAYKKFEGIVPDSEIIRAKQLRDNEVFEVKETGAKVVAREAKIILDLFVNAAAEEYHKLGSESYYQNPSQQTEEQKKSHPYKCVYDTKEKALNGAKYFYTILYMPRSCKQYLDVVQPVTAFAKKREAENHVALLAIQALYSQGLYSKHLYPKIGYKDEKIMNSGYKPSSSQITTQEEVELKQELQEFHLKQKKDKSKEYLWVNQKQRTLVSEPLDLNQHPHLYVYVIKGINADNTYPYKSSTDFLGFVFNRQIKDARIEFQIHQENRQRQKNQDHLLNLQEHGKLSGQQIQLMSQLQQKLTYEINPNCIKEITFSQRNSVNYVQRLRFFHTWIFYSMYNGDHKFYKSLLKGRFSFGEELFAKELSFLKQREFSKYFIQQLYGNKSINQVKSFWSNQEQTKFYQYLVPIKKLDDQRYVINEDLINNCIGYIKVQLLRLVTEFDQHSTLNSYNLETNQSSNHIDQSFNRVWTCEQNKLRHVILTATPATKENWKEKSIIFSSKKIGKDISIMDEASQRKSQEMLQIIQGNNYTNITGHYFYKCGLLLSRKENTYLTKCRKERHFLDFTIQKEVGFDLEEQEGDGKGGSSTQFDIPQQLLSLFPLSYDQYQVAQQACSFLARFNEFLMVENFILTYFKDRRCYQEEDMSFQFTNQILEYPLEKKNDVFLTTEKGNILVSQELIKHNQTMVEALTSPTAHRETDYERLEFLGDSIISFLVILELYLTKGQLYREGDLDFHRIKTVSNMNFMKVNKKFDLYQYMIFEPSKIFSEFTPGGLDMYQYQNKLKHKHLNELNNKIKYLKQYEYLLKTRNKKFDYNEFYSIVCKFMKKKDIRDKYLSGQIKQFTETKNRSYNGLINREGLMQMCDSLIRYNEDSHQYGQITSDLLQLQIVMDLIHKIETQKRQAMQDKKLRNNNYNQPKLSKVFFYKQLADIVESVSGAVYLTCGFNATQDYLRSLEILKFDQNKYKLELDILEQKQKRLEYQLKISFYEDRNLQQLEQILGYSFKCKTWLIEALTHKSFNESLQDSNIEHPQDYELLEFLGDSILNSQVAKYFFMETKNDIVKKNPKELHKMKTSIVNNVLLSLILIENNMHQYVIYNEKAFQFKFQFESYVHFVKEQLNQYGPTVDQQQSEKHKLVQQVNQSNLMSGQNQKFNFSNSSIKLNNQPLDLDLLYEHSLKIFGDAFEALIGAVFLDSRNIQTTERVLFHLLGPYIPVYANLDNMQDHSRTKLLELWNSRPFTRNIKVYHKNEQQNGGQYIVFRGFISSFEMLTIKFDMDAKNKVRTFYKKFFKIIEGFIKQYEDFFNQFNVDEHLVLSKAKEFSKSQEFQQILNAIDSSVHAEVS